MLKTMQREPSWSYVFHFIIHCSHFSFCAISQACFHVRWKLPSLHNHFISQPLLQVFNVMESFIYFQQFCNHSFICGISMLLKHVTKPWTHCKLVAYFVFKCWTFSNKQDRNIVLITELKVKYSWINMLPVQLCFLKPRPHCFSQDYMMICQKLFAKNFYGMP